MAKKTSTLVMLGAVALIVIASLAVYAIFFQTKQTIAPGQTGGTGGGGTYISTGSTTLRYAASDSATGAAISPITQTRVGETGPFALGVTTASPGDKLYVLFNATGYHTAYLDGYTVPTAPTSDKAITMKGNGTVIIDVFNTDSVKTTGTGTVNQTATVGGVYNLRIRLTGSSNKDTGPMRCTLESEAGSNTTKIELTGLGAVKSDAGKPNSYTLLGAGSSVWVYDIDAVVGATTPEGNLVVTSATGKTIALNRVKVTCQTKESFIDPNTGLVVNGIEDSNGLLKSINSPTQTIYFS